MRGDGGYHGGSLDEARRHDRGGRPLDSDRPNPESERPVSESAQAPSTGATSGEAPATGGTGTGSTGPGESPATSAGGARADAGSSAGAAGAPGGGTPGGGTPGGGSTGASDREPRGLIAQLKATKDAVLGVLRAHIELGKAEADAIKGEIAYAAAFAGMAIGALLLLALFLPIATMLFLGEWLFGSIGWGVLLGTEMLIAAAATALVTGLRLPGPVPAAAVGVIAGVVAFIVFGASWFNRLWAYVSDNTSLAIDPAYRQLVIAIVIVGIVFAVVGLLAGARAAGIGGAIGGLVAGFIVGGLVGAFLAYDFGWRVGAALGFATFYAAYLGVLGARVASGGIDFETIKLRFWPQQTIDTTRETIEWAKARNPLGPKS